jgi:hypothetical protein
MTDKAVIAARAVGWAASCDARCVRHYGRGVVRRRQGRTGRHELMNAERWPQCDRFDAKTQPCLCWFSQRQRELVEAGGWPGGDAGMLSDYLELAQHHHCSAPFDWSVV